MSAFPVLKGILQSSQNYTWNTADCLGRGATAVVYLGREKTNGKVVAVKVFHEHLRVGQSGEDLRELELLRRLSHENIITLHAIEHEFQSKRVVLVMEYCEGGSLYHMLDQPQYQFGLPEELFLLVLFHVAAGMLYLRKAGVIHRDIKPGNIMRYLTDDGNSIFKLTDFGAARDLTDEENFTSLYGTEEYLHPGMYQRAVLRHHTDQQFDARVDLWSLGVTFYHVATGQLPFQPYGGRSNRETMYHIITKKESGVISGQQHFEEGPIHWSRELPNTCQLSSGLRHIITPLLAGLMEPDTSRMLSYEQFFGIVDRVRSHTQLSVFHYTSASLLTLYADPRWTLSGLQDALASMTDLHASQQLLLVGGHTLEEIVDLTTEIANFPVHIRSAIIYLFPCEMISSEVPHLQQPEIPPFPEFLNIIDIDKDSRLALNCLARGHLIKQHTQNTTQQQLCLVEGHMYLRTYIDARLRATADAHQQMQQLVSESKKRFDMFYSCVFSLQLLCSFLSQSDSFFKDILNDETLRKVHVKAEERSEEINRYRRGLQEKVDEARHHASNWGDLCSKQTCTAKVEHHLSVISNIQNRFRRDKSVKNQMTGHDENIHRFERQKLQEHCLQMLSILTGHCIPTRDHLHIQAFSFVGMLLKALIRIIKVEKNIESVINCQQLLSSRLDKIQGKCTEEVHRLQKQLQYVKNPSDHHESKDEGLGTSHHMPGLASLQISGDCSACDEANAESLSLRAEFLSLKAESRELFELLQGNLQIVKRLEEDASQMQSSGSLSRNLKISPS